MLQGVLIGAWELRLELTMGYTPIDSCVIIIAGSLKEVCIRSDMFRSIALEGWTLDRGGRDFREPDRDVVSGRRPLPHRDREAWRTNRKWGYSNDSPFEEGITPYECYRSVTVLIKGPLRRIMVQ